MKKYIKMPQHTQQDRELNKITIDGHIYTLKRKHRYPKKVKFIYETSSCSSVESSKHSSQKSSESKLIKKLNRKIYKLKKELKKLKKQ